ncbi:ABC transporter ATP-binding protein [Leifsonia lichenia]
MSAGIRATAVDVRRHGRVIVSGITLDIAPGTFLALTGPNGAGKTTLLHTLAGILRPSAGSVTVDGADVAHMPPRVRATTVALVEQLAQADSALTAREVVGLGRVPHYRFLGRMQTDDGDIVERALAEVGLADQADERWDRLSGGQRQRAQIARALAQEPTVLFLDEPTNHLDIEGKLAVLGIARRLTEQGMTVVACLHDLDLAAAFADRVVVMQDGGIAAVGAPQDALSPAVIERVFHVRAELLAGPGGPGFRFQGAS